MCSGVVWKKMGKWRVNPDATKEGREQEKTRLGKTEWGAINLERMSRLPKGKDKGIATCSPR